MGLIDRLRGVVGSRESNVIIQPLDPPPLLYSWILSGRLAVGQMPQTEEHWLQLESAGFRSRFSCCFPEEDVFAPPPQSWMQARVSLPDHRNQEILQIDKLQEAIQTVAQLVNDAPATYLHCLAGMERSPLIATGLVARERNIDLLSALDAVRLCHPIAKPIYEHLDVLDQLLRQGQF